MQRVKSQRRVRAYYEVAWYHFLDHLTLGAVIIIGNQGRTGCFSIEYTLVRVA